MKDWIHDLIISGYLILEHKGLHMKQAQPRPSIFLFLPKKNKLNQMNKPGTGLSYKTGLMENWTRESVNPWPWVRSSSRAEQRLLNPGTKLIMQKTDYANTSSLFRWMKRQPLCWWLTNSYFMRILVIHAANAYTLD